LEKHGRKEISAVTISKIEEFIKVVQLEGGALFFNPSFLVAFK